MDLFELIKVILGRWRVVVPILLVTVGVAYLVQTTTPSEYEANGIIGIETPELDAAQDTTAAVDPVALADGIQLDGDAAGRDYTVVALGGANYQVSASASTSTQAADDVEAVVAQLAERVTSLQEGNSVAANERSELRLVDPRIIPEPQPDDSWLATADLFLYDPSQAMANPYLPNSSTGRLLEVALMGDAGQASYAQLAGEGVTVQVGLEARDAASLIEIVVTGPDPERVIEGFYHASDIMAEVLEQRQERANVLPGQRLTLGVLDAPLGVVDQSPPVNRATAGVIALGGLMALGLALGMEGLERRRKLTVEEILAPADDATTSTPGPTRNGRPPAVPYRVAPASSDRHTPTPPASVPPDSGVERLSEGGSSDVSPDDRESQAGGGPSNAVLQTKLRTLLADRSPDAEGAPPSLGARRRGPGDGEAMRRVLHLPPATDKADAGRDDDGAQEGSAG